MKECTESILSEQFSWAALQATSACGGLSPIVIAIAKKPRTRTMRQAFSAATLAGLGCKGRQKALSFPV